MAATSIIVLADKCHLIFERFDVRPNVTIMTSSLSIANLMLPRGPMYVGLDVHVGLK